MLTIPDDKRCTAKSKHSGERCRKAACAGLTVCHMHGGAAPRARAKSAAVRAAREFADLRLPTTPVSDPVGDLLMIAGKAKQLMSVLESKVSELTSMRFATATGEQTRGELLSYERALDRCHKILADIVRLDLEARMTRVSELQAVAVVAAVDAGLRAAGLSQGSSEWDAARGAAGESLRSVTAKQVR